MVIHPQFWSRRRVVVPGHEPMDLPTASRQALTRAGFDVIEKRQPSFLFEGLVLVTGEVDRSTALRPVSSSTRHIATAPGG